MAFDVEGRKLPHIGFAQNVKWLKTECGHSTTLTPFLPPLSLSPLHIITEQPENILSETAKRCRLPHVSFNGSSRYCSCCRSLTGPTHCCCCCYFLVFVFVYTDKLLMTKSPQLWLSYADVIQSGGEQGRQLHLHYKRQLPTAAPWSTLTKMVTLIKSRYKTAKFARDNNLKIL